jgi:hypothetical protein
MRGTTVGISNLARVGLVLVLIGACTPQSTPPPVSSTGSNAPSSTDAPSATSSSGLDVSWEPLTRPGAMDSIAYGARGWVALEDCGETVCSPAAHVWHSTDLIAWAEIALPRSGDVIPISISANSDSYLAVASDFDDVGEHGETFTQVWRSSDGLTWERVGELRSGECTIAGCPHPTNVGLAPNGSIFVGAIEPRDGPLSEPFLSEDGVRWRDVVVADYSQGDELDRVYVAEVVSTPTDLLLIGEACLKESDCGDSRVTIWGSTDGDYWVEEQSFGRERVSIASDGVRRVVTVSACEATYPPECTTDVWTGLPSRVWTNVSPALDLAYPKVAWTGDAFVIVGERLEEPIGYVSRDGSTWTQISDIPATGSCGARWLVGGAGVVLFGVPQCALWKGVVQPAR